jgi:methylenetetrahydrofolate reductase (NADPH)
MRPGTLGICASIKHKYDVDTVPHVLCGGFTKKKPNIYWWIVII